MSEDQPPESDEALVLVIAADRGIESRVGDAVTFAGHRPIYDATVGAAGESIRRIRPDVTVLDMSLPRPVIKACLGAADEVGARPVLLRSTGDGRDAGEAATGARFFVDLRAGPEPLARVLDLAYADKRERPVVALSISP